MSLFDFFKKPSKKQTQIPSPEMDKELMSPEMQKKHYEAAMEFVKELQEKIPLVTCRYSSSYCVENSRYQSV